MRPGGARDVPAKYPVPVNVKKIVKEIEYLCIRAGDAPAIKEENMMEKLIKILEEIQPGIDYHTCEHLIDDHYLNSLAILALVAELEEAYDIVIPAVEIVPDNFNCAQQMYALITKLLEEE